VYIQSAESIAKSGRERYLVHTMADMGMKWSQLITPAQLKIVASAIVSVIFLRYLIKHYLNRHTQLKRAPGPFPFWPVVGNLPLLGKLPHHSFYQLSKRYGDIMELKLGSVRTIVVSSPELAKEVFKQHDLVFASRPDLVACKLLFYGRDIAFSPYGEHWRHMRKVSTLELFTLKRLEASKHVRDEELSWLVHGIFENCKVILLFHSSILLFFHHISSTGDSRAEWRS
jgi:hypothetical protein